MGSVHIEKIGVTMDNQMKVFEILSWLQGDVSLKDKAMAELKELFLFIVNNRCHINRGIDTCGYCGFTSSKVEAGGIHYCPNPLCTGPGAEWFRCKLGSFILLHDTHEVNVDEWFTKGVEYLLQDISLFTQVVHILVGWERRLVIRANEQCIDIPLSSKYIKVGCGDAVKIMLELQDYIPIDINYVKQEWCKVFNTPSEVWKDIEKSITIINNASLPKTLRTLKFNLLPYSVIGIVINKAKQVTTDRKNPEISSLFVEGGEKNRFPLMIMPDVKINVKLLNAVQMAYRKHCLDDEGIGWDELETILHNVLCESMGDVEYQKWLEVVTREKNNG